MQRSIREATGFVVDRLALEPAKKTFEMDEAGAFDSFVVPYAPLFGQIADAVTTQVALKQPGMREANPVARSIVNNVPVWYATKIGVGAFTAFVVRKAQKGGHRNLARVVSAIGTAAGAGPALSNLRQMGKL